MGIITEICKGVLVVRMEGEFDMQVADQFRTQIDGELTQAGLKDVVVALANVSFIDSSGVGALLGRYKKVTHLGGRIAISEPQPAVEKILRLSGVLGIIPVYRNEAEAYACF